jgi:MFS family permease
LGVLDVAGMATLAWVYFLSFALGCVSAVDAPIRQSFTIEMVGPEQLPNAVALNSLTFNLARIIGPALAGLLITMVDTGPVFLINAVTSLAVLAGLFAMRTSELIRSARATTDRSIRSGVRYVRRNRHLVVVLATVFVVATFGLNFPLSLALLTANTFEGTAGGYGLLSTMLAVGTLSGALVAARRTKRARLRNFLAGALVFGVFEVVVGVMPTFWLVAVMLVPVGVANIMFTTAAMNIMQLSVESEMRGRVMGIYMLCFLGGTPVGSPLLGWLAEVTDPRAPLIVGGVISAVSVVVCGLLLMRATHLRPSLDHGRVVLSPPG